jgi:sugar O-acyltransferase (sialic acid O-acetyltransferase NeuD family)
MRDGARRILIIGAGGHAKVVADIVQERGLRLVGFVDDDPATWGTRVFDGEVLGPVTSSARHDADGFVIGIGSNAARLRLAGHLAEVVADRWFNALHPAAVIARSVRLGRGVVVAAGAVINPDTTIGDHVIVNTVASVDHDCNLENFVHVAPGVRLAGGVRIATGAFVGLGATVLPGRSIGAWSTVGASAAVLDDVPASHVAVGVPARIVRQLPSGWQLREP